MKIPIFCLSLAILLQPALAGRAIAQALVSDTAWDPVKQLEVREKLIVELKDGRIIKGRFLRASDEELSVSLGKKQIVGLKRDEMRKVWHVMPPDKEKQRVYSGIGIGVGLLAGLAVALSQADNHCSSDCRGETFGLTAALVVLPIAGGLLARKLAGGGERTLIYQIP
jgi:hypothetical protein